MEPRHFWRRIVALVIDFVILSQLALYLALPFADGETLRLSGGLYQSVTCNVAPLEDEAKAYFAERGVTADKANICVTYQNGFYAGSNLLVSSETNAEGEIADTATTISVAINRAGEQVEAIFPVTALAPATIFLGIILMTWLRRGQTIGKQLAGVQVVKANGDYLSLLGVAKRETLKFAPAILLFALGLMAPGFTLEQVVPVLQRGENVAMVMLFLGGSTFAYILWWVAPLIWWNGTMPYDRMNGSMLERHYS